MKTNTILLIAMLLTNFISSNTPSASAKNNPGLHINIIDTNSGAKPVESFISFEALKKHPSDSIEVTSEDGSKTQTWIGVPFMRILQDDLQIPINQVEKLTITAPDGYSSVLTGALLHALKTAICAYQLKDQQWPERYGYMRFIFPELRNMYWVNEPTEVEIILGQKQHSVTQYYFYYFDSSRFQKLVNDNYKTSHHIAVEDILHELQVSSMNFNLIISDGLVREYPDNDISRYFVLQKIDKNSWALDGINVPAGLKLQNVIFLSAENKGIFLKALDKDEQAQWNTLFWAPIFSDIPDGAEIRIDSYDTAGKKLSSLSIQSSKKNLTSIYEVIDSKLRGADEIDFVKLSW